MCNNILFSEDFTMETIYKHSIIHRIYINLQKDSQLPHCGMSSQKSAIPVIEIWMLNLVRVTLGEGLWFWHKTGSY